MGTVFAAADTSLTKSKKLSDCPVDRLDPCLGETSLFRGRTTPVLM
jgi:hypothetical protein